MKKITTLLIMASAMGFSWAQADDQNQNPQNFTLRTDHGEECTTPADPRTQLVCWAPEKCPAGYDSTVSYCDDNETASYRACGYECRSIYLQH